MTALEIDQALSEIMKNKCEESQQKLACLPPNAKQERKALRIEMGMYGLLIRFGQLHDVKKGETPQEQREHVLYIREQMMLREKQMQNFPKFEAQYHQITDTEEKKRLIAAYHAEIQMRCQMVPNYLQQYQAAKSANNVEETFEAGIKVAVVEEGFRLWEQWRIQHSVYPGLLG